MTTIPPPFTNSDLRDLPYSLQEWLRQVRALVTGIGGAITWASIDKTGSNVTDILTRNHDDLQNISGGTAGNFYHYKPGQITATSTNDNASAGMVGEYLVSTVNAAPGVSLTTGTDTNITSISLTAGDWDISGNIGFNPAGTTTIQSETAGIGTNSATMPSNSSGQIAQIAESLTGGVDIILVTPVVRISTNTTPTVYLIANAAFGISTMKAYGQIRARRVR